MRGWSESGGGPEGRAAAADEIRWGRDRLSGVGARAPIEPSGHGGRRRPDGARRPSYFSQ